MSGESVTNSLATPFRMYLPFLQTWRKRFPLSLVVGVAMFATACGSDGPCVGADCNSAIGEVCAENIECESGVCSEKLCVEGSCSDGIVNRGEIAIDCGGPCDACPDGTPCTGNADCLSGDCGDGNQCVGDPCFNNTLDEDETDVDCGGPTCDRCGTNDSCLESRDCTSRVCSPDLRCTQGTCSDLTLNESETDVDCGGSECGACSDGSTCLSGDDCLSLVCADDLCQSAVCGDGVVNDSEQCDDSVESAACNANCTTSVCGDGIANSAANESCDDSGESVLCNGNCTASACGDGVRNPTAGESCDDGNLIGFDGCSAICKGDGEFSCQAGQDCSDGCSTLEAYRATLSGDFVAITLSGSADPQGVSCNTPALATQICNNLRTGTTSTVNCNGLTWSVGVCSGIEINATIGAGNICSCRNTGSNSWTVRPCIGNNNWGGMNTNTCGGPSQSLVVDCLR